MHIELHFPPGSLNTLQYLIILEHPLGLIEFPVEQNVGEFLVLGRHQKLGPGSRREEFYRLLSVLIVEKGATRGVEKVFVVGHLFCKLRHRVIEIIGAP